MRMREPKMTGVARVVWEAMITDPKPLSEATNSPTMAPVTAVVAAIVAAIHQHEQNTIEG
jgi:Na+-transporting methylmalonyl-CoA/oxaloacetate decarboxylase gamma subunit